ncbi:hypothetical protein [Methanobacterium sp.]|uniref:hypothetical protein n=1 Tax=Methanobacterium sp. TaxID=2164 RepID=UPI003158BEA5
MSPKDYNKKVNEETSRTRISRLKNMKRVEMEYLDAVKKQMGYWNNQINATDPQEDEDRYNELKNNAENEKEHIKQVQDELNRINQEIERELNIRR